MLSVKNLRKVYRSKKAEEVVALNNVSIDFPETGFVFLLGKSGSGKSTLLNAIGGLDKFDGGEIIIKGKSSADFTQADFDSYRNTFIGFIFQEYNILENFSVAKNLALALELQGKKADNEEVMKLLRQVEMEQYAKRKPNELSGGQKQRVAIARALIKNPEIIMADEPTGALDSNTGKQVMDTLKELSKTKLVIVVSHDREFAEIYGDRIIELKDGKVLHDITKKEIAAEETKSGIKIIDNDIVYIKKGQEVTPGELKQITDIINERSKSSDTFISFNKDANDKLKEGAKINDSGNKEKFVDTEKEDIKIKQYNPNSLQLIKSRLGFMDSLKMGASALKNKVGKLIFTIILSFFAFTVFGIIDALGQWNRASSVYEAMSLQNQKTIAFRKSTKESTYVRHQAIPAGDLAVLQNDFKSHTIKGVAKTNYGEVEIKLEGISYSRTNNPLWQPEVNGYVGLTQADLDAWGFTKQGRLPESDNEICVSQHIWDALVKRTSENEESKKIKADFEANYASTGLMVSIDGFDQQNWGSYNIKIVGVIDDKTDLSTYTSMKEEDIMEDRGIENVLRYGFTNLAYTTMDKYNAILENSSADIYYYLNLGFENTQSFSKHSLQSRLTIEDYYNYMSNYYSNIGAYEWYNYSEHRLYTEEEMNNRYPGGNYSSKPEEYTMDLYYEDRNIHAVKDGVDIFNLAEDEIIVYEWAVKEYIADYQKALNDGLTAKMTDSWDSDVAIKEFKVVGIADSFYCSDELEEDLKPLFAGYDYAVSVLTGDESVDEAFVKRLETFDEHKTRFTIHNASTPMLDMLEEILLMMTSVFVWIALGFAVFASLMLMNFISTSISYKKREIGVLRALGARGSDVFGIFFNESLIIAAINFVLSSIATIIVCNVINGIVLAKLPVDIALLNAGIRQIVLILGVSVLSAFLGSFLPTFKISRKRPIDAINNR